VSYEAQEARDMVKALRIEVVPEDKQVSFSRTEDDEYVSASNTKASMAAYMRWYRSTHREEDLRQRAQWTDRRSIGKSPNTMPFAAFDCEGGTTHVCSRRLRINIRKEECDNLSHEKSRLVKMICGNVELRETSPGKGLAYYQIFNALCQETDPDQIFVGFSNGYDISMILATVETPMQIINLISAPDGAGMIGNDDTGWWFVKYRRGLEFSISPQRRKYVGSMQNDVFEADPTRGHYILISDTFKLFGKSFLKVIDEWKAGIPDQRKLVKRGKDNREYVEYLTPEEIETTDEYCRLECRLLEEVMETLRHNILESGMHLPDRWQSPGYLSRKVLQQNHVMTRQEYEHKVTPFFRKIFLDSYYGGWFETIIHGPAPGICGPMGVRFRQAHLTRMITQWDINSAYPWALTHAPCPRHFTIEDRAPRKGEYALQYVVAKYEGWADEYGAIRKHGHEECDSDLPAHMGLPWRGESGRICRPLNVTGWYWSMEVAETRHQTVEIIKSYTIVNNCECDAWGFLASLFHRRLQLKKDGKDKPLKLVLNAIYGVLAQTVGSQRYAMPMFASFITAFVRAHIMRTIHQLGCEKGLTCGWNVLMVATDAVYVVGDPKLPVSSELGGWSKEEYPNGINIVQGGIYFTEDDTAISKSRGFPAPVLQAHIPDFKESWRSYFPEDGELPNIKPVRLTHRMTYDSCIECNGTGKISESKCDSCRGSGEVPAERVKCKRFVGAVESVYRATLVSPDNKRWFVGNLKSRLGTWEYLERTCAYIWNPKRDLHWQHHGNLNPDEPLWTVPVEVSEPKSTSYSHRLATPLAQAEIAGDSEAIFQDILNDTPGWETDND
jgi:DNA polymerase type B, organellar and viral